MTAGTGAGTGIGIADEHRALQAAVERWAATRCPREVPRGYLDAAADGLPPFWDDLGARGWLGLAVSEAGGGEGFGPAELVVVVEQLGAVCAPGPFVPTAAVAVALDRHGTDTLRSTLLPGLVSGRAVAAVALAGPPVVAAPGAAAGLVLDGTWDAVPSAALADHLLLPVTVDGAATWVVVDAADVTVAPLPSLDPTRPVGRVTARAVAVPADRRLAIDAADTADTDDVADLVALLLAAEAVGVASWCVATAAEHARVRHQFGRPIGQFQAVKHRCADMLCRLEQARAAVWLAVQDHDPAGARLATAVAVALATEAAYRGAKDCIQVLGGIGFTWEHDAHLYLKRATATRLLVGGPGRWRERAARSALAGARCRAEVGLPADADVHRAAVQAFLADLRSTDKVGWNRRIAEAGYLVPHWPAPWGRGASAVEQLVIDEELRRARVRRPHLAVGAWALPAIMAHGTPAQQERWIPPTLAGDLTWCQMFSEPGAGSDLASLTTKARRVDGGWALSGQKVWTSMAHTADWGICLARTGAAAARHQGIGCFLVDMASPGIEVRPLRELTGMALFNEVFLSDVFVPDDCVVGDPGEGWAVARTTLANERVSMGAGSSMGPGVEALLALAADRLGPAGAAGPAGLAELGEVVADAQSLTALGTRLARRAVDGTAPGPEASIRKLLGVEHDQRVQEVGLELLGPEAVGAGGEADGWIVGFLANRSLSIAGGTSEIQRNVIAERLLGLPRDA